MADIQGNLCGTMFKSMWRVIIYFIAILGFNLQTGQISKDYFSYPTTTYFSIMDTQPETIPPAVVVGYPYQGKKGNQVTDIFTNVKDQLFIVKEMVKKADGTIQRIKTCKAFNYDLPPVGLTTDCVSTKIDMKMFYRQEMLFLEFSPKDRSPLPPSVLLDGMPLYELEIVSTFNWTTGEGVFFSLNSRKRDLEGYRMPSYSSAPRIEPNAVFDAKMTYSTKVSRLLPPPYDTMCMDYSQIGLASREACFSKCLNELTLRYSMIIESHVISREILRNHSSLTLIPWYFRTLERKGHDITMEDVRKEEREDFIQLFPSFKNRWKRCRHDCNARDCNTEYHILTKFTIEGGKIKEGFRGNQTNLYMMSISLLPPTDQVLMTTSDRKYRLLDFVIYLASTIGFWFGICPLQTSNLLEKTNQMLTRRVLRRVASQYNHRVSRGIKVVIILLVVCSFTYQTYYILDQYFRYPVSTLVSMTDIVPNAGMPPPKLTFETSQQNWSGLTVEEVFQQYPEKSKIAKSIVKETEHTSIKWSAVKKEPGQRNESSFELVSFLKMGRYYLSLPLRHYAQHSHDSIYATKSIPLYTLIIVTNLQKFFDRNITDYVNIYMTPKDDDMEGITKGVIRCTKCGRYTMVVPTLTYSVTTTKLLPSPYETNCREYRKSNLSSPDNCLNECLNQFTLKHGMIIESNVLPRSKFEKSHLIFAPWKLKYLDTVSKDQMTQLLGKNNSLGRQMMGYHRHWRMCKELCRKPNCLTQSVTPEVLNEGTQQYIGPTVSVYVFQVHPPRDQVIKVETTAKYRFLDVIMYLLSSLSFWFGFCPLQIKEQPVIKWSKRLLRREPSKQPTVPHVNNVPHVDENKHRFCTWQHLFPIVIYLSVLTGFTIEMKNICDEYFMYHTTTQLSLEQIDNTTIPKITLKINHEVMRERSFIGQEVRALFAKLNHTNQKVKLDFNTRDGLPITDVDLTTFVKGSHYLISFGPRREIPYSPSKTDMGSGRQPVLIAAINHYIIRVSLEKHDSTSIPLTVQRHDFDNEGSDWLPLSVIFDYEYWHWSHIRLSYSMKITNLSPPPFDTNCRDYRSTIFTSK